MSEETQDSLAAAMSELSESDASDAAEASETSSSAPAGEQKPETVKSEGAGETAVPEPGATETADAVETDEDGEYQARLRRYIRELIIATTLFAIRATKTRGKPTLICVSKP